MNDQDISKLGASGVLIALSSASYVNESPIASSGVNGVKEDDHTGADVDEDVDEGEESSSDEDYPVFCDESDHGSDMFAEFDWLEQMDGTVTHGTSSVSCDAKLMCRDQIISTFYDEMEQPTLETSHLAFDLFDRYGRLSQEFRQHPTRKGSGIWQDELDSGDMLLFEEISVDELYRRRKLGSKLVQAILETGRRKSEQFWAFACLGSLALSWIDKCYVRQDLNGSGLSKRRRVTRWQEDLLLSRKRRGPRAFGVG